MGFLSSSLPHTSCFPGLGGFELALCKASAPGQALPADPQSIRAAEAGSFDSAALSPKPRTV